MGDSVMNRTKLLIADDEADLLAELEPILVRAGFDVITAHDGEQTLRRIDEAEKSCGGCVRPTTGPPSSY
jgi:DNA-binding NtrC family response regulator